MSIRTPLAKARGLGPGRAGTEHWMTQRITAVFIGILTIWFVVSLLSQVGADYQSVHAWLSSPIQAAMMVVYLVCVFYHSQLGIEVIMRDYIHNNGYKIGALVATRVINVILAAIAIMSVLTISLGVAG